MASLQEYVARQFPEHQIDVLEAPNRNDLELTDNTVVSYVVGSRAGMDLLNAFHRSAPQARVAAVEVRPTDPTVVPTSGEDSDGVVDLPTRRIAVDVVAGLLILGLAVLLATLAITRSGLAAAIAGAFGALIGAFVGAIIGASRFAGQRANTQPRAPGRNITVVAAFLDDDASATTLARRVGPAADFEVRIVDHQGGWRSPGTGTGRS
jgi:hypothetical protein